MPLGVSAHQSPEEDAEINALLAADTAEGDGPTDEVVTSPVAEDIAPKEQPAAAQETADSAEVQSPKGDPRAALRASRRSEHRKDQEIARLREENATLQKSVPALQQDDESLTAQELEDFPSVAKLERQNKALKAQLDAITARQQVPSQQSAAAEFEPPSLPPALQDVVDDIPALLTWQNDPDQTAFELAKIEDTKLLIHPKWKDKLPAERLAEVARRVSADLYEAAPAPSKPRVNVDDAIANAPRVKPHTLADIGGGGEVPKSASNLSRYSQMSDDDITAELLSD